jgi:D-lactate dehydrogenase (cytochrome)
MKKILKINTDDMDVICQPGSLFVCFVLFLKFLCSRSKFAYSLLRLGVSFPHLDAKLREVGLVFPLDAGPQATVGGMIACGASGIRAVRYGAIRNHVLSLRVVMADGSVIVTSKRAKKSVSGYDLTRLFVGSEGTLGIIVEATLRVYPIPKYRMACLMSFADLAELLRCVLLLVREGLTLNMVELLDASMVSSM